MIVVDASVVVDALIDDASRGDEARARLDGERGLAPEVLDLEVIHAVGRLSRCGLIDDQRSAQALLDLAALPYGRASHRPLLGRTWELRNSLTPYDAVYVALAEAADATLVTVDAAFAAVPGIACSVELLK